VFHSVSVLLVREMGVVLSCKRSFEWTNFTTSPTSNDARENLFIWQLMEERKSGLRLQSSSDARFPSPASLLEQVGSFSPAFSSMVGVVCCSGRIWLENSRTRRSPRVVLFTAWCVPLGTLCVDLGKKV